MHLEDVAACLVKPGDDDDLVAYRNPMQSLGGPRIDLEPRIRSALRALFRSIRAGPDFRPDHANRSKREPDRHVISFIDSHGHISHASAPRHDNDNSIQQAAATRRTCRP
jgi:hypothetical protein